MPNGFVMPAILLALIMTAQGCDNSGAVPVHGRVTFQGQPLENATVTFFPESGRPVDASVEQGEYHTELVPGDYTSIVNVAIETPPSYGRTHWNQLPPQKFVLPEQYTTRAKSTLKATVKADQSDAIDFVLK